MNQFPNHNSGEMNNFKAEDYPVLSEEINQVKKDIHHTPVYFKSEIIISFLKNHSLKSEWVNANPVLAKMITSGSLVTRHIEQLFESSCRNLPFCTQFERHLKRMFI